MADTIVRYDKKFCALAKEFLSEGFSKKALAAKIGIAEKNLYEWIKKHPEFKEAVDDGYGRGLEFWEKLGIDGARGMVKGFNVTSWIFNMKNRYRWTDRQDITTDGEKFKMNIYTPQKFKDESELETFSR